MGGSPGGDLDPEVAVDGDGEQREDGALGDDEEEAGEEEAGVELRLQAQADHHGQGDDQHAHGDVRQRQRHDEAEGGVAQRPVYAHHQDHQHVAQHRGQRDGALHRDVHHVHVLPPHHAQGGGHLGPRDGSRRRGPGVGEKCGRLLHRVRGRSQQTCAGAPHRAAWCPRLPASHCSWELSISLLEKREKWRNEQREGKKGRGVCE